MRRYLHEVTSGRAWPAEALPASFYDFVGSSVTRSVTLNGHYNFHYDEQLEKSGPLRVLVVTSWNEI